MTVTILQFLGDRFTSTTYPFAILAVLLQTALWDWQSSKGLARRNMFFGMRVQPEFIASPEAGRIQRRFRGRIWFWSVGVVVAYLFFCWQFLTKPEYLTKGMLLPPVFAAVGSWIMFGLSNRETRRQATALPAPGTRTAALFVGYEESSAWFSALDWLAILLPIGVPFATISVVILRWNEFPGGYIPARQLMMALFAALVGIFPACGYFALRFGARSSDWAPTPQASRRYRTALGLMLTSAFSGSIFGLCGLALIPLLGGRPFQYLNPYLFGLLLANCGLLLVMVVLRSYVRKHLARGSSDPMPDHCWKWGYFYYNPADPAAVVPLRSGTSFSFNHANRSVWLMGAICVAICIVAAFVGFS